MTLFQVKKTIYGYAIYGLRGPDEKNCARSAENGPSPNGEGDLKTECTVGLMLPVNNMFIF